jgi:hypothetical protein
MAASQYKPFFQIISMGLKTNTNVLVKTVCTRKAAEQHAAKLMESPLSSLVQYRIVERPKASPFEVCDDCPSRKTPVSKYYLYHA